MIRMHPEALFLQTWSIAIKHFSYAKQDKSLYLSPRGTDDWEQTVILAKRWIYFPDEQFGTIIQESIVLTCHEREMHNLVQIIWCG
jgi:hypothetical protein